MEQGQDPIKLFTLGQVQMRTGEGGGAGGGAGAGEGANPPGGNPGGGSTEGGTGNPPNPAPNPEEGKTFDAAYVSKLRGENAEWRVKSRELEQRIKAFEDEKLTAEQKAKRDLDEATTELTKVKAETRRATLLASAATAGASVPQAILGMIDGDGDPDTEVAKVKKQFPQLFKPAAPGGGADAGAGKGGPTGKTPGDSMNALLRRAAGRQ